MSPESVGCIYCGSEQLRENPAYFELNRITSDCKPWLSGGRFAVCESCGHPQTLVTAAWKGEVQSIYECYSVYYQSGGMEQSVYDSETGEPFLRSDFLVRKLFETVAFPATGRLLDVGCGNGNFLRAFAKTVSGWQLNGMEWDDKYLAEVNAVQGFETLYTEGLAAIPGSFDVISLIHCIEHIPAPVLMLQILRDKLAPGGLLFVEVPDCSMNPFMLLVADHCSHFSNESLRCLVQQAGFTIACVTNQWLSKEISLVAYRNDATESCRSSMDFGYAQQLERHISWLRDVSEHARTIAESDGIAIFGTSITATWLYSELKGAVRFFVDEDLNRVGRQHCGCPIYSPEDAPKGVPVYLALPPQIAEQVSNRLSGVLANTVVPPDL